MNTNLHTLPQCEGQGSSRGHDRVLMGVATPMAADLADGYTRYECPICGAETTRKNSAGQPPTEMPPLPPEIAALFVTIRQALEHQIYPLRAVSFDRLNAVRSSDPDDDTEGLETNGYAVSGPTADQAHLRAELLSWWERTSYADLTGMIDKIHEYGGAGVALDLVEIGQRVAGIAHRTVGDEEAIELGIGFYLQGKISRWHAATIEGGRPSDDTLMDIVIYAMMARRNRAVGGWPHPRTTG